nr:uncharacterized protein LOC109169591 isoform X1 [Ipomoea batatas]
MWLKHYFQQSRDCFGCCTKSPFVISSEKRSRALKNQGLEATKKSLGGEFWSSSTGEMDNSTVPSQRSVSSISTSNLGLDCSTGTTNNHSEFVNHGFLLWNQIRQQWVGNRETKKRAAVDEPKLSFDATYDSLLGTNKPFPQPIPLSEMVDFLVDVWEQDGLYD